MNIDVTLGKRVFHPIIIRWCQWRGCDQHTFANYAWTLAFMAVLTSMPETVIGWVFYTIYALCCFYCIQRIALTPNKKEAGQSPVMRLFFCFTSIMTVLHYLTGTEVATVDDLFGPCVVFAEYARTITTIPPRKREAKTIRIRFAS